MDLAAMQLDHSACARDHSRSNAHRSLGKLTQPSSSLAPGALSAAVSPR
jgi:hypothetical protein